MKSYLQFILSTALLLGGAYSGVCAQNDDSEAKLKSQLDAFFIKYKPQGGAEFPSSPRVNSYDIDDLARTVSVNVNETFAMQEFKSSTVSSIYRKLGKSLPRPFNKYRLRIITCGMPIDSLVEPQRVTGIGQGKWGSIDYSGPAWVQNTSRPGRITHGLAGRHIALWASHGRYFDTTEGTWKWQRPNLFGTTEDLFTQTIVVPYLIPMLQNAGAVVFTPRERDWQCNEVIVDNDVPGRGYVESGNKWVGAPQPGFGLKRQHIYADGENPFADGTARMTLSTTKRKPSATVSYQPNIPEAGNYAVYVSYQTVDGSVPDAEYTVYHKGQQTTFRVNQQMGGGTWVYLGNFDFDRGFNEYNRVVISNRSGHKGLITTDAVRFGGGMGNIQRGGAVSGLPRCLEGARYYTQWAGAPYKIYGGRQGTDDYSDDINVRSLMTNWLAGGSVYLPTTEGGKVPLELSLAVHSDAGYDSFGSDIIGSLSICTTQFNDGRLGSGVSRMLSHDFASMLLSNLQRDLRSKYKRWTRRDLLDKNYSETRLPQMPSAIIETLSHQSFPDMLRGQDPNFKFAMARSIYKTILQFIGQSHALPYIMQPLAPDNLHVEITQNGHIRLAWTPTPDADEPTATPTAYNVYIAQGTGGFDNGHQTNAAFYEFEPEQGSTYNFKVTAVNRGGESFPSEVISAVYNPQAAKTILIVNGFHRLSSPAVVNDGLSQGFDLTEDIGVQRGLYAGWNGAQLCFDKNQMGNLGPHGLGFSGDELAGKFIAGNDFNYVAAHAEAIGSQRYNIISCSSRAIEAGLVDMSKADCIDLILGLEKNDGHSLAYYKTFSPTLRQKLSDYVRHGGRLIASGAYIGSDMSSEDEREWIADVLKCQYQPTDSVAQGDVNGLGMTLPLYRSLNHKHYAVQHPETLSPTTAAFCAMQYADGQSAAVAYDGADYKAYTAAFPLECISDQDKLRRTMAGILAFVMK